MPGQGRLPYLRVHHPRLYRFLAVARVRQRNAVAYPLQLTTVRHMRGMSHAVVDFDQEVGMGGLLANAALALNAGRTYSCGVTLRFTAATYMPSWAPDDWLDAYFVRLDQPPVPDADGEIKERYLPRRHMPAFKHWGELVWSTISIRPEIRDLAAPYTTGRYAAIHYRGSDKYLESPRVPQDAVLRRAEEEMKASGLDRVFVASDEPEFVEMAHDRFGSGAMSMPLEAVARQGRAAHYSDVSGEVKAHEALATMVALSGAEVCVRTESYLSAWAQTLARPTSRFILVDPLE